MENVGKGLTLVQRDIWKGRRFNDTIGVFWNGV